MIFKPILRLKKKKKSLELSESYESYCRMHNVMGLLAANFVPLQPNITDDKVLAVLEIQ